MLARRSTLNHPNSATPIDLPLLIPSFSSKGFPTFKEKGRRKPYSDVSRAMELIGPYMNNSMLISAYDIHHGYLKKPQRYYKNKEIIFIDSGGYELSEAYDSTEPNQIPYKGSKFTSDEYLKVIKRLPNRLPFVITNHDWENRKKSLNDQIKAAHNIFNQFPNFLNNFLIKPSGKKRYLDINEIVKHTAKLKVFNILGVTEKELGKNLLDRLVNIAKIRSILNRKNINIPIHVWGGLDPVITPLYFFAGAELFDGISWLRYAYHNGVAVYRDSFGVLEMGIETPLDKVRAYVLSHNLSHLSRLKTSLQLFAISKASDFSKFDCNEEVFRKAYETFLARVQSTIGGV